MHTPVPEIFEASLGLFSVALAQSRNRRFDDANRALAAALINAPHIPEAVLPDFRIALIYCTLLVQFRKAPESVTIGMRSQASALLDHSKACNCLDLFQRLMFEILTELGEQRRAIPFGERGLAIAVEKRETTGIAEWLWKIGRCYSKLGLHDHAAIAYRRSARSFRNEAGDPRLPVVLLALGNAIRKSNAWEAERLYKEAATLWERKGQLESATPAWMNLGIVCSDQERFEDAIDYYERVRKVRESSPATPPVKMGVLYNNLASCYRKMARYNEAHQAIERSISILTKPGALRPDEGNSVAASFGTKGMILRDEGRVLESLEWFRRACDEFENQPSPNFENVIEELEHLAAALTLLDRKEEARIAEEKIERVRKAAAEIPSVSDDGEAPVELTEGALLIELDGGLRGDSTVSDIAELGICLSEILKGQNLGQWQGLIRIPECSTLLYYGSNAEQMFGAIESALRSDWRFEGAVITIRQLTQQREVILPRRMVH
jgi:tetratricopeptide (TPR) repeat protein